MEINPVRKEESFKSGLSNGVKTGCCGFPVARQKYFRHFNVVELQQTFYQPPRLETAMKWRKDAPPEFEFTLKIWQLITHPPESPTYRKLNQAIPEKKKKYYGFFKPTDEVFSAWEEMNRIADVLKARAVVFQCPASFKPTGGNKQNLKRFFSSIERKDFYLVWEPRGPWQKEEIKALCEDLGLIHCVDPFKEESLYGEIAYFRLHGKDGYRYQYTDEELKALMAKVRQRKTLNYVMFNNVYMFEDARRFSELNKSRIGLNMKGGRSDAEC
ncbi:MAG: DUF72 domain-containing protein [Nitrospirota bacterium]